MKKIKIGYFADGPWSHEAFKLIISDKSIDVKFIVPRSDTTDLTLQQFSEEYDIDYLKGFNINSDAFLNKIEKYNCDLFVSMSFNQIFKTRIINTPPLRIINCHAGKLPFYRGRNILNWVLINDESEFGITVHFVDEGIDTGDIILQRTFPIGDKDNYSTLLEISYIECAQVLYDALKLIQSNQVRTIKQKDLHPVGFYCGQRGIGDEIISWNQTSRELFNFIRSISKPGPMAQCQCKGELLSINNSRIIKGAPNYRSTIGQVVGVTQNSFIVKTKDSTLEITDYYYKGKIRVGDRLS